MLNNYVFTYINDLIDERMYLIYDEQGQAIIIDPFYSKELENELKKKNIQQILILLTHEHYDHISGVNKIANLIDTIVCASDVCKVNIEDPKLNKTKMFPLMFLNDREKYSWLKENLDLPYFCTVDKTFTMDTVIQWNSYKIRMIPMPAHSPGSSMYIIDEEIMFAGDNILGNTMELKSYLADKQIFLSKEIPFLSSMDSNIMIYPGHGEPKTLKYFLKIITKEGYVDEH